MYVICILGRWPFTTNKELLYCIVLYCIVLYCIVLYCIVLYCIQNGHRNMLIHEHCARNYVNRTSKHTPLFYTNKHPRDNDKTTITQRVNKSWSQLCKYWHFFPFWRNIVHFCSVVQSWVAYIRKIIDSLEKYILINSIIIQSIIFVLMHLIVLI